MPLQIEALFAIAALNGLLGYVIFRGGKDALNILYGLVVVSVSLWALFLGLFLIEKDLRLAVYFSVAYYIAAAAIPVLFFVFSLALTEKLIKKNIIISLTPLALLVAGFLMNKNLLIQSVAFADSGTKNVVLNKVAYLCYTGFFLIYVLVSYILLYRGYKNLADILKKKQILLIAIGTSVSYLFGLVFNLVVPFWGNYQLIWAGPLFTVCMIGAIAYAILRHKLFTISLIVVEITLISLNFFLLVNLIFSKGDGSFAINASLFVSVFLLSAFLLRGIYKDIRDRERIEGLVKDMEVANERLRMMEGQKTEFVSIASHQLRTPLTVIKGYASMILEGTFGRISEEVQDAMEKLYKSSEKIVALVEDLLTVSRIEQGRMMLVFETINFKDFVAGIVGEMGDDALEANIDVAFNVENGKEFFVAIDEKKFKQVVKHILENAIKYTTASGSVRVNIQDDNITNKVRLIISDTGIGMMPEQITSIFERFNLKESADAKPGSQTAGAAFEGNVEAIEPGMMEKRTPGIGLYIAQEIIEAHNGVIRIESAGVGRGTTVVVELPRVEKGA